MILLGWLVVGVSLGALHAQESPFEKLSTAHLPNAIRVHPKVISGGLPADYRAFEELKSLGVKTIISVDAAVPDVALARQFGMRYVHLPHGYDGIPEARVQELAKAILELDGPIYIHCHHGQHRSPAATAVGCVTAGLIAPEQAVALLTQAGTSVAYRGLYRSVRQTRPAPPAELTQLQIQYRERAQVPALADAMVSLEHTVKNLKTLAAREWQPLPEDPGITAAHEALLLSEQYAELSRTADTAQRPAGYQQLLQEAQLIAEELQQILRSGDQQGGTRPHQAATILQRIEDNCRNCHTQFRDNPIRN